MLPPEPIEARKIFICADEKAIVLDGESGVVSVGDKTPFRLRLLK